MINDINTLDKYLIIKANNKRFVINIDEAYARDIYEVLKAGQIAKGEWPEGDMSFDEWVRLTWQEGKRVTGDFCDMTRRHCDVKEEPR